MSCLATRQLMQRTSFLFQECIIRLELSKNALCINLSYTMFAENGMIRSRINVVPDTLIDKVKPIEPIP